MRVADRLSSADIMLDVDLGNKPHLLETLANELAGRVGHAKEEILDALKSREALGSTALGRGVALPHARLPDVPPTVLFVRLTAAIEFDAQDGAPVDLLFLILWPAADTKGLLDAMSEICRALRRQDLPRQLRAAPSAPDVIRILRDHLREAAADDDGRTR